MPKGHGGKRNGAGRERGRRTALKPESDEIMARAIALAELEGSKFTPLE
jgi:hypothetical protein